MGRFKVVTKDFTTVYMGRVETLRAGRDFVEAGHETVRRHPENFTDVAPDRPGLPDYPFGRAEGAVFDGADAEPHRWGLHDNPFGRAEGAVFDGAAPSDAWPPPQIQARLEAEGLVAPRSSVPWDGGIEVCGDESPYAVWLSTEAWERIVRCAARAKGATEQGGYLLGEVGDGIFESIRVRDVTVPLALGAKFTRSHGELDFDRARRLAGEAGLRIVGRWHTHPGSRVGRPSAADIRGAAALVTGMGADAPAEIIVVARDGHWHRPGFEWMPTADLYACVARKPRLDVRGGPSVIVEGARCWRTDQLPRAE